MLPTALRHIWTICKKDIYVWLHHPSNIVITFAPPLALLLLGALGAQAVGRSPVALVQLDHAPAAQQMVRLFHSANVFRLQEVNEQQAQILLKDLSVVAVITIPADFTRRIQAHMSSPLDVTINNLNLDFTTDIRRSVPDVITQFYSQQGNASPFQISMQEQNLRSRDIEFFQYSVLPTIVFMITISGLVTGGLTSAREWETRTITELLLSPVARSTIVLGKVGASFFTTFCLGTLILFCSYLAGWIQPHGFYWITAFLMIFLLSLFSAIPGITIGMSMRRIQPVSPLAINIGMYLFFLAGGIGVLAFEPPILQQIATVIPLTYGRHALEMALFYNSSEQLGRDIMKLCTAILVALIIGTLVMRRKMYT